MNSLVVLLSVVAFAAAKPSGLLGTVTYSSPIIAAGPSAVSSQSRVDIKTSPAVVATSAYSPISHNIIAEQTLLSAPAAIAPISRSIIAEPTLLSAPAAVSSQSRIDIKSTPAVTTSVISSAPVVYGAAGLVKSGLVAPAISAYSVPAITTSAISAYSTPAISAFAGPAISTYAAPAISAYAAPAISTYSAPVISTYSAPAIATSSLIKTAAIAAPSVPLDTPEVIAARAAHLETKWLTDAHLIRKRSVVATPLLSTHIATPLVSTYAASAPLLSTYATGHLTYATPIVAKAYGVHAW